MFFARRAWQQGDYAEAEKLYLIALGKAESVGRPHWRLAASLGNLAENYRLQGRYAEAEPLFRRAIEIDERCLNGKRSLHPRGSPLSISYGDPKADLSSDLNNLALLCMSQGRYDEVESLLRRSIAICRDVIGPEHSEMAIRLRNLAILCHAQGKDAEAEEIEAHSEMTQTKRSH